MNFLYPPRTRESDKAALALRIRMKNFLSQNSKNARVLGSKFMVSVVTTDSGRLYVGISGSKPSQETANTIKDLTQWVSVKANELTDRQLTRRQSQEISRKIDSITKSSSVPGEAWLHQVTTEPHPLSKNLIDFDRSKTLSRTSSFKSRRSSQASYDEATEDFSSPFAAQAANPLLPPLPKPIGSLAQRRSSMTLPHTHGGLAGLATSS